MPTVTPTALAWAESVAAYGLGSWAVQATLLLAAGLLLARLPRLRPAHRHAVLLTALCLAALAPVGLVVPSSLRIQASLPAPAAAAPRRAAQATTRRAARAVNPPSRSTAAAWGAGLTTAYRYVPAWVRRYPALLLGALGAAVAGVRFLLLLLSAGQVAAWVRRGRPLDRDRLYAACGYRVADIPVLETPGVQVPSVVGAWRPVILLPVGLAGRVDARTLGHVLFHEEGHARRRDPLFRLVSAAAETVLFWHPLVPLVRREWETAAEDACDTHALERGAARTAYARTLLSVLEMAVAGRARPLTCRLGKRGSELKRRVTRILTGAPCGSPVLGYLSLGAMLPTLGASALLEVGTRPGNPFRHSGIQAFRHSDSAQRAAGREQRAANSARSQVRSFNLQPSTFNFVTRTPEHPNTRTPHYLNAASPTSLAVKPGTWRPAPGSFPVEQGAGAPGESRDLLPRRDHLTVFLLDISGSMTAQQAEARRQVLMRIEALPAGDRFNVVAFNSRVLPYVSSSISPTAETLGSIRSWMEALPQETGADLAAGLRHALAHEGVTSVILFSDGNISRGISARPELMAVLQQENRSSARVLAVIPETAAQHGGRAMLDPMPERTKGEIRAFERLDGAVLP